MSREAGLYPGGGKEACCVGAKTELAVGDQGAEAAQVVRPRTWRGGGRVRRVERALALNMQTVWS